MLNAPSIDHTFELDHVVLSNSISDYAAQNFRSCFNRSDMVSGSAVEDGLCFNITSQVIHDMAHFSEGNHYSLILLASEGSAQFEFLNDFSTISDRFWWLHRLAWKAWQSMDARTVLFSIERLDYFRRQWWRSHHQYRWGGNCIAENVVTCHLIY